MRTDFSASAKTCFFWAWKSSSARIQEIWLGRKYSQRSESLSIWMAGSIALMDFGCSEFQGCGGARRICDSGDECVRRWAKGQVGLRRSGNSDQSRAYRRGRCQGDGCRMKGSCRQAGGVRRAGLEVGESRIPGSFPELEGLGEAHTRGEGRMSRGKENF